MMTNETVDGILKKKDASCF